jgi:FMN phosphatase YigB (HAD superfamily)
MTLNFLEPAHARPPNGGCLHARALAHGYEVISFDVFETLLHREGVFRPSDLFLEIGLEAEKRTGIPAPDFARLRSRGERDARGRVAARGGREIGMNDIYAGINRLLVTEGRRPWPAAVLADLIGLELKIELDHLRPISSVKPFYDWAVGSGKIVVLVSDFYASADFVGEALARNGYDGHHQLFVSSDLDQTKHHGGLYDHVAEALGVAKSAILHVGDNPWSDGSRALQAGIAHIRIANPAGDMIRRQSLDTGCPAGQMASAMLFEHAQRLFGGGFTRRDPQALPLAERIGEEALGPLLLGMASWLYAEAGREGFSDYFFCARDGLIIKRAFDLYQQRFGARTGSHYLELSRQVIYRARAAVEPDEAGILFAQNWSRLTPADALTRWGLDPADHADAIAAAGFSAADEDVGISGGSGQNRFLSLFEACSPALMAVNGAHLDRFTGYLRRSGLIDAGSPCMVDIGWHGSLQRGLDAILPGTGFKGRLAGRYLGLFLDGTTRPDFPAAGYLFSRDATPIASALRASPSLVELLHTAETGSITGYAEAEGEIVGLTEDRPEEAEQYRRQIAPVQAAALDFVARILAMPRLRAEPVPPEDAFRGLDRLLNRPAPDEVRMIGAWRIAANYGATATSTALTERSPAGYRLWNAQPLPPERP